MANSFQKDLLKTVQTRLKTLGWYSGPVDGEGGPSTRSAMTGFKLNSGLRARPYPGPLTLGKLFSEGATMRPNPKPSLDNIPPWLIEAKRLQGVAEVAGRESNPVILNWADGLDLDYSGDDIPWCGLFVAHCMRIGAPDAPQPANVLGARNWQEFGRRVEPELGAILVFWRGSKSDWKGHVGFYLGEDANCYFVLGGNQSDAVTIARISKHRLLSARIPDSIPPSRKMVQLTVQPGSPIPVSTNEA
ncbi:MULTISPECIES: TIGR02594 family protein [unclassified Roseibium]|uniref:NlpC/P60 family protein n=1 Tax=unclassified Roseibium TaxID=2629323 RepID=UPI00273F53D0|nr:MULTISPECIES: TIGR02594 family protein [unclassified Roseibium]